MLLKDLITVAQNARWLPTVMNPSEATDGEFRRKYAEDRFVFSSPVTATRLIRSAIVHRPVLREGAEVFDVADIKHPWEQWFFVNGICTDRDIATLNAACLSSLFKKTITVIHNPTHGIVSDLVECVFERTFDQTCQVSHAVFGEILAALFNGQKVKLIGHSQGGIIVSRVLRMLQKMQLDIYKNIEVYTFASGTDEDVQVKGVIQEHFANTDDFVSRIGILNVQPKDALYVRRSVGHLLNRDYLEHFATKQFCGGTSRLYSYVKEQ